MSGRPARHQPARSDSRQFGIERVDQQRVRSDWRIETNDTRLLVEIVRSLTGCIERGAHIADGKDRILDRGLVEFARQRQGSRNALTADAERLDRERPGDPFRFSLCPDRGQPRQCEATLQGQDVSGETQAYPDIDRHCYLLIMTFREFLGFRLQETGACESNLRRSHRL